MTRQRIMLIAGALLLVGSVVVALAMRAPTPPTDGALRVWPPLARDVEVEVLNATTVRGVGRDVASVLRRAGLDVVMIGDADAGMRGRARSAVIVRRRDTSGVGRVREVLGDVELIHREDDSREVDLSVVVGRDARQRAVRP